MTIAAINKLADRVRKDCGSEEGTAVVRGLVEWSMSVGGMHCNPWVIELCAIDELSNMSKGVCATSTLVVQPSPHAVVAITPSFHPAPTDHAPAWHGGAVQRPASGDSRCLGRCPTPCSTQWMGAG